MHRGVPKPQSVHLISMIYGLCSSARSCLRLEHRIDRLMWIRSVSNRILVYTQAAEQDSPRKPPVRQLLISFSCLVLWPKKLEILSRRRSRSCALTASEVGFPPAHRSE